MQKIKTKDIYKPLVYGYEINVDLESIKFELSRHSVNLSPSYQKGSVWTLEQRENFMGHLLSGGEVLPIIWQKIPAGRYIEILDGKQRTETILKWLDGEFAAKLSNGQMIYVNELDNLSFVLLKFKYINLPFEERKQFYVRFNSAGTPHTKEQLQAALEAKE